MPTQRPSGNPNSGSSPPQHRHALGEMYIGVYDFETNEADQFSFKQGDTLTIVHKEPSGWWAAFLGGRIGWVPAAYLEPLSISTAGLSNPPASVSSPDDDRTSLSLGAPGLYNLYLRLQDTDGTVKLITSFSPIGSQINDLAADFASTTLNPSKSNIVGSRSSTDSARPPCSTYSPPATSPVSNHPYSKEAVFYGTSPSYNPPMPHQLSLVLEEGSDVNSEWSMPGYNPSRASIDSSRGRLVSQPMSTASSSISVAALHRARLSQASMPWYLWPKYAWEELKLDSEGLVVAGTVPALIERLLLDKLKPLQEQAYRTTFLTTLRLFTTADHVFETLLSYYEMEVPPSLSSLEAFEWKEKKLGPTQTLILEILTQWVEKHAMLDEQQLIPNLRKFLESIQTPPDLALRAKQLLDAINRVPDDDLESLSSAPSTSLGPSLFIRRLAKPKAPRGDFVKWDSTEVANHITLMESRAYNKVRPHECLSWTRSTKGPAVVNLTNFIGLSDRLAAWIKLSILSCDSLGKRADTVDHWIKIAERCRALNNIFSMSTIVAALSSGDISKLRLTWAHVSRASNLEQLVRITEPTGNFSNYKGLHNSLSADTACIPFITVFLTELVHINNQYPDTVPTPPGPEPEFAPNRPLINFVKLCRLTEVVLSILKFSGRHYSGLSENTAMTSTIEQQIEVASAKDTSFFWKKSQDLQIAEASHAEIWKNLNNAGF